MIIVHTITYTINTYQTVHALNNQIRLEVGSIWTHFTFTTKFRVQPLQLKAYISPNI